MRFIEYPDRDAMAVGVAGRVARELSEALSGGGSASLAVPGGSTPGPVFDTLRTADIDWRGVTVLPTDERWVAETSERSNSRMIRERLLVGPAAAADFLPVFLDGVSAEDRVDFLDGALRDHLPLSVLILGMGTDMHVASLFPESDGLERALKDDAPAFLPVRQHGGGPVERRMSLTLPVLNGAMKKHLMIMGSEKRDALERARMAREPMLAPVVAILPDTTVHWAE